MPPSSLRIRRVIKTIIKTEGGARKETRVYGVVGKNPGPLLWDEEMMQRILGSSLSFNLERTQQNDTRNISRSSCTTSWRLVRKRHRASYMSLRAGLHRI